MITVIAAVSEAVTYYMLCIRPNFICSNVKRGVFRHRTIKTN